MTPETANERFHRLLFLGLQRLRGRPIGAYIRQLQEWERLEPAAFHRLRAERLAGTLEYTSSRVPFYRSGPGRVAWRGGNAGDLQSWPVLERATIQAHSAELLAEPTPPGHYLRRTSGSSGSALGVAMDADAASWAWATDYRGLLWHGISVGARCIRLIHKREGRLAEWVRNLRPLHTDDLSVERLQAGVRYMQTARPVYVSGYVAAVTELARYARASAPDAPRPLVPFAKVLGEMLHPFQRQEIEQGLGARVIETYGCNETGTVGFECPAGSLHVFAEHVEVEILKDGEPVEPGEMGDIALTCTTNRVMPLIRYRVGDRGRLSPDPCSCGRPHPVLAGIEGRVGDLMLTSAGVPVHGAALGHVLKEVIAKSPPGAVGRVIFEQHDRRSWTVLVQAGPGFGDGTAAMLTEGVKAIFGNDCQVALKQVPEIPGEPSGKFRFYRMAGAPKTAAAPVARNEP
ncbi:MAG: phenylacetate--CoA ligase family protein [Gemmatimonadales bacterium]|nr:phenylacetate--CoA ligase family protein [Gemmatimonadales bacterium]